jgi:hypothetical protein
MVARTGVPLRRRKGLFFAHGCYWDGCHPLRGILPILKERFWPTYAPIGTPGGKWHGREIGRTVDRQITRYVRTRNPFKRRLLVHFMRPETRALLQFISAQGWKPVWAQKVVGSHKCGAIGTAIDLVVRDTLRQCLIAIEIKCGYGSYFGTGSGKMRFPIHDVDDSPLHQAAIQLLTGMELARRSTTRPVNISRGCVLRVEGARVDAFQIGRFPWANRALQGVRKMLDEETGRVGR